MKRSDVNPMPRFFDRYINLVEDIDVVDALERHSQCPIEYSKLQLLADKRYAGDKWTVKDILQHVIDTERIVAYRALRFARNDQTPLTGFDEKRYGAAAGAAARTVDDLLEEFRVVRQSSIFLFRNFSGEMLKRSGQANQIEISVLALGFMIAGHPLHHWRVIEERYFPLIG